MNSVRRPGPESTLGDVKERLIEAAMADLLANGVGIGLEEVTLSSAIAATGASRATAYRSLSHADLDPQAYLREEVISRVLLRDTREENREKVARAVTAEIERRTADLESNDAARRTAAFRSIIRVGAAESYTSVANSCERSILIAAYGATNSRGDDAIESRLAELRKGEADVATLFSDIYHQLASLFQYRLRPQYDMADFATAVAAFVEGLAMRSRVSSHLVDIYRPTGVDGGEEPWTLFAIGVEGMFTVFFEPNDPANPFVDLTRY